MNAKHWLVGVSVALLGFIVVSAIVLQPHWLSVRVEAAFRLLIVTGGVGIGVLAVMRRRLSPFLCGLGLSLTVLAEGYRWGHLAGSSIILIGILYGWKTRAFIA